MTMTFRSPDEEAQHRAHLAHLEVESVEQSLSWTANYMAFHDGGDPELEHPYPPSEP
jgi:hypothetical protein